MRHKRRAKAEAILRREAAHRDVQRLAGEENFPAADQRLEAEFPATRFERLALVSKFGAQSTLLSLGTPGQGDETDKEEKRMSWHMGSFGLLGPVAV